MAAPEPIESQPPDLLDLEVEGVQPRALARLGLLTLAVAAGMFMASVLFSFVEGGAVIDVLVFTAWLGVALLAIGGGGLLLVAAALAVLQWRAEP